MEADGGKSEVALAKAYFAIQTRRQEISEQFLEDRKKLHLREQVSEHNKSLAKTAKQAGVFNYGNFVDYGYLGLYGMRNKDILKKKKLKPTDALMDNIGSEELAANLFRATQAEAKIKREHNTTLFLPSAFLTVLKLWSIFVSHCLAKSVGCQRFLCTLFLR